MLILNLSTLSKAFNLKFRSNLLGRTTSECSPKNDDDHMGVHSEKQKGPHWSALQNAKGTTRECNALSAFLY